MVKLVFGKCQFDTKIVIILSFKYRLRGISPVQSCQLLSNSKLCSPSSACYKTCMLVYFCLHNLLRCFMLLHSEAKILRSGVVRTHCSSPFSPSLRQLTGKWQQPQPWYFLPSHSLTPMSRCWLYDGYTIPIRFSTCPLSLPFQLTDLNHALAYW